MITVNTAKDETKWRCKSRILKYAEDITPYKKAGRVKEFYATHKPFEVVEREGNCALNAGITLLLNILIGDDTTNLFSNTYAELGVGDSATAAAAAQTDLQAAVNKAWKAMDAGFPTVSGQTVTFQASFGADAGNYAWNEWAIRENQTNTLLNRKVGDLGTKSGKTWTLQVEISLS